MPVTLKLRVSDDEMARFAVDRWRYPGVELKIAEFGGLTVQQAVSNGELDMAMTALPIEEGSHLTTLPLFNHPLCVLTPRTAPWEGVTSLSPAELAAYPLVIYNEEFALSQQLMRLFTEHDVKPRIAVRSGQWDFLAAMVQAGMGVAILPDWLIEDDLRTGRLIHLLPEWQLTRQGVYALYPDTRHLPLKVRVFIDFMKHQS